MSNALVVVWNVKRGVFIIALAIKTNNLTVNDNCHRCLCYFCLTIPLPLQVNRFKQISITKSENRPFLSHFVQLTGSDFAVFIADEDLGHLTCP